MQRLPPAPTAPPFDVSVDIRPKRRTAPTDSDLAALAERQHGAISVAQMRDLGLSPRAARHRLASGRLSRVHQGVYAVRPLDHMGHCFAAHLACGRASVISHLSAGALWGLVRHPATVHVTVPPRSRRRRAGLRVHHAPLGPAATTLEACIPCTTVARTLLDLAATCDRRTLDHALARAEELRIFDLRAIRRKLDDRHRRGTRALVAALDELDGAPVLASPAEARFLAHVRRAGLPEPQVNVWLPLPEGGGLRPDFLWRERGLVVEIDGRRYHARRAAFDHDRRRDRRLQRLGLTTARFSASEVVRRPAEVVAEVAALLRVPPRGRS